MTVRELKRLLNQYDDTQEVSIEIKACVESENVEISSEDLYVVEEDNYNSRGKKDIQIMNDWAFEEYCKNRLRS